MVPSFTTKEDARVPPDLEGLTGCGIWGRTTLSSVLRLEGALEKHWQVGGSEHTLLGRFLSLNLSSPSSEMVIICVMIK